MREPLSERRWRVEEFSSALLLRMDEAEVSDLPWQEVPEPAALSRQQAGVSPDLPFWQQEGAPVWLGTADCSERTDWADKPADKPRASTNTLKIFMAIFLKLCKYKPIFAILTGFIAKFARTELRLVKHWQKACQTNEFKLNIMRFFLILTVLISFSSIRAQVMESFSTPTVLCSMCKRTIERELGYLPGVQKVEVDLSAKETRVWLRGKKTGREEIIQAITAAGYDAENQPASPEAYRRLPDCCRKETTSHE